MNEVKHLKPSPFQKMMLTCEKLNSLLRQQCVQGQEWSQEGCEDRAERGRDTDKNEVIGQSMGDIGEPYQIIPQGRMRAERKCYDLELHISPEK